METQIWDIFFVLTSPFTETRIYIHLYHKSKCTRIFNKKEHLLYPLKQTPLLASVLTAISFVLCYFQTILFLWCYFCFFYAFSIGVKVLITQLLTTNSYTANFDGVFASFSISLPLFLAIIIYGKQLLVLTMLEFLFGCTGIRQMIYGYRFSILLTQVMIVY